MTRNEFRRVLLKRALLQKKTKTVLVILATAMGTSVLTALLNLEVDLRSRMNRQLRDYGPNVLVLPDAKEHSRELEASRIAGLDREEGVTAYSPQLFEPVLVNGLQAILVGADLSALMRLYPGWEFDPAPGSTARCFLGSRLAKKLQRKAGDAIEIQTGDRINSMKVDALVESGEAEDDQVFVSLADAQQWTGREGRYHVVSLSVLGELPEVEARFRNFVRNRPGVSFQVVRKIAAAETQILNKISRLMSLVLLIIFVTLLFCIHTTVSAILLSRQSEIALFRVLGARRNQITQVLTIEVLTLGIAGGIAGYAAGVIMAQVLGKLLFQTYVVPRVSVFIITILSSLAMMVLASFLPIRRAVNRQAAVVLKEA